MADRLVSVDSSTYQLPANVRATQAANLKDKTTPEGLALSKTFVTVNELVVDVKDFGATGDGVTDDTVAIKAAIAFACAKAVVRGDGTGYKSYMPVVFFPAGRYVVSQEGALNCVGNAIRGYALRGAGYQLAEIIYTHTPAEGADSFLITNGGSNWFAFSYMEDLAIYGNGFNSAWRVTTQAGAPQANRFRRVSFTNLKKCVTVEYGTANSNGDLFRFESCKASDIKEGGWVFGIPDARNSQSIVHSFVDCDFESVAGTILYFKAGGSVEVRGGSWIVNKTGRILHIDEPTGSGIGYQAGMFAFYGTKIEWRHFAADTFMDYAPLFYINAQCNVSFNNMTFGQFSAITQFGGTFYDFGHLAKGRVLFNNCYLPSIVNVRVVMNMGTDYVQSSPTIILDECVLSKQVYDMISQSFTNGYNMGRFPTVVATGCHKPNSSTPVDVTLWAPWASQLQSPQLLTHVYVQSVTPASTGLPTKTVDVQRIVTFKLPRGATLKRVGVVYGTNTLAGNVTHTIQLGATTVWTNTYAPTTGPKAAFSPDLMLQVVSEADRTVSVVCDGAWIAAGGIAGYVVAEYL
jgi:hypothetical protein